MGDSETWRCSDLLPLWSFCPVFVPHTSLGFCYVTNIRTGSWTILWDAQQNFLIALNNLSPFPLNWIRQNNNSISLRGTELGTRGLKHLWEDNCDTTNHEIFNQWLLWEYANATCNRLLQIHKPHFEQPDISVNGLNDLLRKLGFILAENGVLHLETVTWI